MVAQVAAADLILTTIGRVAIRPLAGYLAKNGGKKFAQQYGPKAFEAVLGTTIGLKAYKETEEYLSEYLNHIDEGGEEGSFVPKGSMPDTDRMKQMDSMMAVPNVNPNINRSIRGTPAGLVIGGEPKEVMPPPEPFSTPVDSQTGTILSTPIPEKVDTTLSTPIPEKVDTTLSTPIEDPEGPQIYSNKDISEQTKDLVPEKAELGPLTAVEKQTALALKGNKPDFYSRAVEAITNAKQDKSTKGKWKSIVQSNSTKEEMEYLGLDKYLQGNESVTKEELLKFVEEKDIAPGITVRSIPKDEMNTLYQGYSLGGYTYETQEQIVFQVGKDNAEVGQLFKSDHANTEYGTGNFAHARTQVGFDPLEEEMDGYQDLNNEEIKKAFKNTLIIDEIQSDWLQEGAKKGFVSDYEIVPGDQLVDYFKKHNISYEISDPPLTVAFQQKDGEIEPGDAPAIGVMDSDIKYFFRKSDNTEAFKWDPMAYEEDAQYSTPEEFLQKAHGIVPDFPIKESKKWVELVLNKMIEKAILDGRDSIAITNGEIQYNRYKFMKEKEREGLKKFYDKIVFKQLEKISDKYNVDLERIDISEGEAPKELQDIHFGNQIKRAQEDGFVLKKVNLQFLWDRTMDTTIPGHAALYSDTGVGQGANYIEDYLSELVDNRPFSPATGTGSGLDRWNEIRNNEVYIWIKEQDISRDIIGWELPIVPVKDALNYAKDSLLPEIKGEDLGAYQKYVQDTEPPKSKEIKPDQLIKMPLPKKLQKDILSKPIKLTKLKTQTNKMLA
jgi:hypothetical protein